MPGQIPQSPKLFHILHHDKLGTVINSGGLFSDAILAANNPNGTIIGMNKIKRRRLTELRIMFVGPLHQVTLDLAGFKIILILNF